MLPIQQGKFSSIKTGIVELKGGMNENVSSLELLGGELIDCKNYMIAEGGYGGYLSIAGNERFDGIVTPSQYESLVLLLKDCSVEILDTETITGDISLAVATALEDGQLVSGTYLGGDALVRVQCIIVSGVFESLETVETTVPVGTVDSATILIGGNSDYHLALDYARTIVDEVPGELGVLGVTIYKGLVYAFRKKVGLAEIGMYVEDVAAGWLEIDTSANKITYAGGHNFKFAQYNFKASAGSLSLYWVDSVNQARSYDGSVVVLIDNTGMSALSLDKPTLVAAHNNHLFLAYLNGSLQHSALGDPDVWDAVLGASEIGIGDEITNLVVGVASSLVIYAEGGIRVLTGTSIDNWALVVFSDTSGAYVDTSLRLLGTIYSISSRGLSSLESTDAFGDYAANSISQKFKITLLGKKNIITRCSTHKNLNQYRIFFEDNSAIYVSFQAKELSGATFIEFPEPVTNIATGEDLSSNELTVFTSNTSGFVYKMDSGPSFDGVPIITRMSTAFYHYGTPRNYKDFKKATAEIKGSNGQAFNVKVDFDYNMVGLPRTIWYTPEIYSADSVGIWGTSKWGEMVYGGTSVTDRVPIYLQGIGTNMSYKLISNEMYRTQHIIQNVITDYTNIGRRI